MDDCLLSQTQWLWDWPLQPEGEVRCETSENTFRATFLFRSMQAEKMEVHTIDKLQRNSFSCSVGLCSTNSDLPTFSRLEIQTLPEISSVSIEAYKEHRDKVNRKSSLPQRCRKMYKIPAWVDLNTLTVKVLPGGTVQLDAARKANKRAFNGLRT